MGIFLNFLSYSFIFFHKQMFSYRNFLNFDPNTREILYKFFHFQNVLVQIFLRRTDYHYSVCLVEIFTLHFSQSAHQTLPQSPLNGPPQSRTTAGLSLRTTALYLRTTATLSMEKNILLQFFSFSVLLFYYRVFMCFLN